MCFKQFKCENARANEAVKKSSKKMCSRECYYEWAKTIGSKNVTEPMKNRIHPRNTKGSGLTTDGYVWIYVKEDGLRNQIKLHRYLMEVKLGRRLREDEIVHHIDGNKLNNSIKNLEIHTRVSHNKEHDTLRRIWREGGFKSKLWSDKELEDFKVMSKKDFLAKYKRTSQAYNRKKYLLKKLAQ